MFLVPKSGLAVRAGESLTFRMNEVRANHKVTITCVGEKIAQLSRGSVESERKEIDVE